MAGRAYLLDEDKAILRFIIDGQHEHVMKGNNMWKEMAHDPALEHRSWQSLRNRFFKCISPHLSRPEYHLTDKEFITLRACLTNPQRRAGQESPKKRNRFMPASGETAAAAATAKRTFALYTVDEDMAIIRHILECGLETAIKGNVLWITMEQLEICPTRTWQSMRNRFLRYIVPRCSNPRYELTAAEKARLKYFHSGRVRQLGIEAFGEAEESPTPISSDSSEDEAAEIPSISVSNASTCIVIDSD